MTGRRVQDLSRFRQPADFRGRSAAFVQLWWLVQATLFRGSPQVLYGWRRWLLRLFGARIGRDVLVRATARIVYPWKLTIGDRSWIGDQVELYSLGPIVIGSDVVISHQAYICTGLHDPASVAFDIIARPIHVQDQAWIAAGVFVHPGVTIGEGSVVSARSVVTRSTEPFHIYAGSPAVKVRERTTRGESGDMKELV